MTPGQILLFAVGGLTNAAYLFIVAAGLSLVFGALRVINMAHGSLYMIAAFVTVVIANQLGAGFGFWTGLLLAVAVAGVIGGIVEVIVLRRVYGREHLVQLLGTYAVSLVIAGGVRIVFGPNYRTVASPIPGHIVIAGDSYSNYSLFMIAAAIVIAAGVWLMLYRTNLGRNIRAAVADPDLLNATGVNVTRLYTTVFMIGAGLAGLGGAIVAPSQAVSGSIDTDVLVLAFAISVIGGLGSIVGSAVGSLIVGMVISFGLIIPATSPYALAFVFIIMTAVLIVRPRGLFGRTES
ncbi:MAG TPA: branched-chain amino acid ABC transporter permease [Candidatus Dormibacteraeota bacterium]|nr:branched-chain amino acid ABC transporter permease [Candidatus Dormibacteraeota bacterium]